MLVPSTQVVERDAQFFQERVIESGVDGMPDAAPFKVRAAKAGYTVALGDQEVYKRVCNAAPYTNFQCGLLRAARLAR
jgi:hypothetical protein